MDHGKLGMKFERHLLLGFKLWDETAFNDSYTFLTTENPFNGVTFVRIREYSRRSTSFMKQTDTLSLEMFQKYLLTNLVSSSAICFSFLLFAANNLSIMV